MYLSAAFVVTTIKERVELGDYGPASTAALIYRTNAQSRALEEACVKQGLPYVIFGSATSFYKRQEVKDCLCFLRWLYNGRDRTSMLRALVTPKRGIGDTAIREYGEYCEHIEELVRQSPGASAPSPLEILLSLSGSASGVPRETRPGDYLSTRPLKLFREFSTKMRSVVDIAMSHPVEYVLAHIVNELELIPYLDKISKSTEEFKERKANVEELRQAARRYDRDGPCLVAPKTSDGEDADQSPLGAFLDDIALLTDMMENTASSTENRFVVSLMTIHASKGMEFDAVFVVGNEDGTLPTSQVSSVCQSLVGKHETLLIGALSFLTGYPRRRRISGP
jgi:DNA helicase II / ATP-dependent DNA helicase PcrA